MLSEVLLNNLFKMNAFLREIQRWESTKEKLFKWGWLKGWRIEEFDLGEMVLTRLMIVATASKIK